MIYVEPLMFHGWIMYGRPVKSCHLMADTEAELHEFAGRIGLKRSWAQNSGWKLHYDLVASKREEAIKSGAVELSREAFVAWMRKKRAAFMGEGLHA